MSDTVIPKAGPETQAPSTGAETSVEEAPEARIVTTKKRSIVVPLDWPVEYDGKTYDSVTIRRVSGKEVEDYIDALKPTGADGPDPLPPYINIPRPVWDAMDDDDQYEVDQQAKPFTPRRLLAAAELGQAITENTSD